MTFLPIVERELRLASRRGWTYWLRVILGAIAVAVVGMTMVFHLATGSRIATGGTVFYGLSVTLLMLCAFVGVFVTGDCLSEEKREGTLGLLFLTDLKGYDVVLGKLMATSLTSFSSLLTILPVLGIVLLLGSVSPGEFWRIILVLLNTLFFSLAAGLLASAANVSERRSRGWALALILLALAGLPFAEGILASTSIGRVPLLSVVSPMTTWRMAFDVPYRMGPHRYWGSLVVIQLTGWLFIAMASLILPRRWHERAPGKSEKNRAFRPATTDLEKFAARRHALLDVNPVAWVVTRRSWPAWVFAAVSLTVIVLLGGACWMEPTVGTMVIPPVAWGLALAIRLSIAWQSCRFFSESRSSGAFELLLCTPLTAHEMIRGQWLAVRQHYLIPAIAVLCLYLMGAVTMLWATGSYAAPGGGLMPIWILIGMQGYPAIRFVADVIAVTVVGMLIGLTARKPAHAAGLTTLFAIVLPAVAACIPNVIIDIPLTLWAWDRLRREIRSPDGGGRMIRPYPPMATSMPPRIPPVLKTG